eukprot:6371385-Pyramimonas_sp.AAC.1
MGRGVDQRPQGQRAPADGGVHGLVQGLPERHAEPPAFSRASGVAPAPRPSGPSPSARSPTTSATKRGGRARSQ